MKQFSMIAFWVAAAAGTLVAFGLAVWVVLVGLPFRRAYVSLKARADVAYKVRTIEQLPAAQVAEILNGWRCRLEDTNSVPLACSLMGRQPSVRNWIEQFNAPLPQFSWFRLHATMRAAKCGFIKTTFLEFSSDNTVYVSEDWSTAVLWQEFPRSVYVFQDRTNGVRSGFYSER